MSFHDDSHILSQLGILDSHERSPKREATPSEPKKFVDVKLTASVSDSEDDDDEDMVFDRNNLLASNKRQNASLVRGRADNQTIRFLVLIILFLISGIVSVSTSLAVCSFRHEVISCLWTCIGMFCGAYSAKLTSSRSNLMLFLLASLLTLLINLFLSSSFSLLFAIRGFFVGSVLYGGSIVWFAFWRKQPRKLLILLFFFSTGGLLAMTVRTNAFSEATSSLADMSIVTRSIQSTVIRLKRASPEEEKVLLPFAASVDNSTEIGNVTEDSIVKKPEVATGTIQKLKTKTEMNAEKEKEVEEKKKEEAEISTGNSTDTTMTTETTTSTSTTTSTTISTTTSTTTTTTTTVPPETTTETVTVDVKTRDSKEENHIVEPSPSPVESKLPYPDNCPSDDLFLSGPSSGSSEEITSTFLKSMVIFGVVLYTISYVLCCLPCGLKPDSKVKKLETDSIVGLGMRLRIIIAAVQTIIGFVQQVKHFHSSAQPSSFSNHITICVFVMITSLIMVFGGRRVGTMENVMISFAFTGFGEFILLFSSSSQIGNILSICGLYSLWISLFLVVETVLHVRSTVQLAYFLIAWIVGRAIACLFALEPVFSGLEHSITVIFTISTGILLFYAIRMLQKSKRLKEILDNSSAPIGALNPTGSGPGEYISLTAQDVMDDDDLVDEEDEMDRSSMDLDYELEQLGLEPIGAAGSRA